MSSYAFYASSFNHILSVYLFDANSGRIQKLADIDNPDGTFLTLNQRCDRIYVGSEVRDGNGQITVYDCSDAMHPKKLAVIEETDGGAAFLSTDPEERFLFSCSYYSGTIRARRLDAAGIPTEITYEEALETTGPFTDGPSFGQGSPRAHCILPVPGTDLVCASDYAGDRLLAYRLSGDGVLKLADTFQGAPGDAIRNFVFHPDDPTLLYCNTEYSGRIYQLSIDPAHGSFTELACHQVLPGKQCEMSASMHLSPDTRCLLSANRTAQSISILHLSEDGRDLTLLPPLTAVGAVRDFIFDPTARYLLIGDQTNNKIHVFSYDKESGIGSLCHSFDDTITPAAFAFIPTPVDS